MQIQILQKFVYSTRKKVHPKSEISRRLSNCLLLNLLLSNLFLLIIFTWFLVLFLCFFSWLPSLYHSFSSLEMRKSSKYFSCNLVWRAITTPMKIGEQYINGVMNQCTNTNKNWRKRFIFLYFECPNIIFLRYFHNEPEKHFSSICTFLNTFADCQGKVLSETLLVDNDDFFF